MEHDILKSCCHLLASTTVKSQFIKEHRHGYPIYVMCRVARGISEWVLCMKAMTACTRKQEDGELANCIEEAFVQNRCVYGSLRIHA